MKSKKSLSVLMVLAMTSLGFLTNLSAMKSNQRTPNTYSCSGISSTTPAILGARENPVTPRLRATTETLQPTSSVPPFKMQRLIDTSHVGPTAPTALGLQKSTSTPGLHATTGRSVPPPTAPDFQRPHTTDIPRPVAQPLSGIDLLCHVSSALEIEDLFMSCHATMEEATAFTNSVNPFSHSPTLLSVLKGFNPAATSATVLTINPKYIKNGQLSIPSNMVIDWYKFGRYGHHNPTEILIFDLRALLRIDLNPLLTDASSPIRQNPFILPCNYKSMARRILTTSQYNYNAITFNPCMSLDTRQFTMFMPK